MSGYRHFLTDSGTVYSIPDDSPPDSRDVEVRVVPAGARTVAADAIVIERSELPEVVADGDRTVTVDGHPTSTNFSAAEIQRIAFRWVAVREHLNANPPVDEAQVSALVALICSEFPGEAPVGDRLILRARRMVAAGVRVVTR